MNKSLKVSLHYHKVHNLWVDSLYQNSVILVLVDVAYKYLSCDFIAGERARLSGSKVHEMLLGVPALSTAIGKE